MSTDDPDALVEITVTAGDEAWLAEFTRRLVTDRLVACGNILPVRSIYAWEGDVADERESLVVLHTRQGAVDAVMGRVRAEHPYEVPQVLVMPVRDAHADYARWVVEATSDTP